MRVRVHAARDVRERLREADDPFVVSLRHLGQKAKESCSRGEKEGPVSELVRGTRASRDRASDENAANRAHRIQERAHDRFRRRGRAQGSLEPGHLMRRDWEEKTGRRKSQHRCAAHLRISGRRGRRDARL